MHNDPRDKRPLENDFTTPDADENILPEKEDLDKERDMDDLVHSISSEEIPADSEEIDPDDAVHDPSRIAPAKPTNETDPDDLVHGM